MKPFDAWFLPGIGSTDIEIREHGFGKLRARIPMLNAAQLHAVFDHITNARKQFLANAEIPDIVNAIDAAAQRLASAVTPEGRAARELLPLATGYSVETIEDVLRHMTADWRADSLNTLLQRELATLPENTIARGPVLAANVFSGNVPGVAVTAMIRTLLVRSATFGKTASGEPVLPVLFAQALAVAAPEIAGCIAVCYWPGGDETMEGAMLSRADALIVYGGEETVRSLQRRAHPNTRVVVHGPRISFGVVGRAADASVAANIARATAAYDQQGCVSPHAVFVERNGAVSPLALAKAVADELQALVKPLPRRRLSPGEAAAVRELRARVEFRGISGSSAEVLGAEDLAFTVLYDDALELPVSCLNRTIFIIPVDSFSQLAEVLEPHRALLQSAAIEGFDPLRKAQLITLLSEQGVSRITTFEKLPWPPMWWHHDGSPPLGELLSWVDIEA